jgi:hypothetical protein
MPAAVKFPLPRAAREAPEVGVRRRRRPWSGRVPALALLALILLLGVFLVDVLKRRALGAEYFRVDPGRIELGEIPASVPEHVADEIRALAFVEPRSIFDPELAASLRDSLLAHPWVKEVRDVRRILPNRVALDVRLRVPVAVVEVGAWRLAVDDEGVVLEDHPGRVPHGLWRIRGDKKSVPRIPRLGSAFACQPVVDGLSVAEDLAQNASHPMLRYVTIAAIDVSAVGSARGSEIVLELANGTFVDWGSARTGSLGPIELSAAAKLDNLLLVHDRNPGLNGVARVDAATRDPVVTLLH